MITEFGSWLIKTFTLNPVWVGWSTLICFILWVVILVLRIILFLRGE